MALWARLGKWQKVAGAAGAVILAGAVVVVVVSFATGGGGSAAGPQETPTVEADRTPTRTPAGGRTPTPRPTPVLFSGLFDGVPMSREEWEARKDLPPLAVMVDNNPAGYPQSGLDKADLVYEAFVEGRITRFLALYWRQESEFIEPVRSARTPFVILASELQALFGHAGNSTTPGPACSACQVTEWGIYDIDSFRGGTGPAFYRDSERRAPHNLVTTTARMREVGTALGYVGPLTVQPWRFKDDFEGTEGAPEVGAFEVGFGARNVAWHVTQWHWDEATNTYLRFSMGGPHLDGQTGEQLRFKNVVVLRAPWSYGDEYGHVVYEQFGTGPATIYMDGKAIEAEWRKPDRTARTRFYDTEGNEVRFNRGSTWIAMIGPSEQVLSGLTPADLPPLPAFTPPPSNDNDDTEPPPQPSATNVPSTAAPTATPAPPTATSEPGPTAVPTEAPTEESSE
ncbi:MAG: DUF3048 domain-containing protein [Dehalococcoidia bacterium]